MKCSRIIVLTESNPNSVICKFSFFSLAPLKVGVIPEYLT